MIDYKPYNNPSIISKESDLMQTNFCKISVKNKEKEVKKGKKSQICPSFNAQKIAHNALNFK